MTDDNAAAPAPKLDFDPVPALASGLALPASGVAAVLALLDEGNTVPFIARYRKEKTGGLDEVQIRAIEERRSYLVELEERRAAVLASITEQGKLTPELETKLKAATVKSELEDLYAPYRPRRKTRASVARERGLQPLADKILAQGETGDPAAEAAAFVGENVANADDALAGARDIVAEQLADTAEIRAFVRREMADHGELVAEVMPGKDAEPTKFEQYYKHREAVRQIPSHRYLAIRRGEAEGVLRAHVAIDTAKIEAGMLHHAHATSEVVSPWAAQLKHAAADGFKRLLSPSVENDIRGELKSRSDVAAVEIFAGNLRNLMLAAPLGGAPVIGVDPGLRTGCKCAAIDATGKFLGTITIYISQGEAQLAQAKEQFAAFVKEHQPRAIAVGNGTGGREAESFVKRTVADAGVTGVHVVSVNEAGASVYSASDLAREEFPELDLTIRGAISIARRLQDPLAELVKIEPKSIGVGQYQHDVQETLLSKRLGDVVEDAVNHVGVELNTASAQLLSYVAGIGKSLAKKIVLHRDQHGAFASRGQLQDVSGLGPKAFEQAAGFLRIRGGANPLDSSAVHPERYDLVEKMAADVETPLAQLVGNIEVVDKIDFAKYVGGEVGEPTLRDIVGELKKPGRDPRAEFNPPKFRDDVTSMEDLKPGMVLEGLVTNVTAFGAFVDIGVHNDGLVHVSQLAESFVKDPSEVVKVGQKIKVRVLEIDNARKRIALSARPPQRQRNDQRNDQQQQHQGDRPQGQGQPRGNRGGRGRGGGGGNQQQPQQQQPPQQQPQIGPNGEGGQQQPHDGGGQSFRGPNHGGGGNRGPRQNNNGGQNNTGGDQPRGRQAGTWTNNAPRTDGPQPTAEGAPNQDANNGNQNNASQNQNTGGNQNNDNRGPRNSGGNVRGPNNGGGNFRGPNNPNTGGGGNNRGPNNPNTGGGGNFRGPNNGGGNLRGPNNGGGGGNFRGPNTDQNRGPRNDGPRNDGPRNDGPRNDDRGPRNDRSRNDGPRNDGPRNDGPRADAPRPPQNNDNWGVSGFTNSPFAKKLKDPK